MTKKSKHSKNSVKPTKTNSIEKISTNKPNNKPKITLTQAKYALLVAMDSLTDEEIAEKLNVNRWSIWKWKQRPEIQQLIAEEITRIYNTLKNSSYGNKEYRIKKLIKSAEKMNHLLENTKGIKGWTFYHSEWRSTLRQIAEEQQELEVKALQIGNTYNLNVLNFDVKEKKTDELVRALQAKIRRQG